MAVVLWKGGHVKSSTQIFIFILSLLIELWMSVAAVDFWRSCILASNCSALGELRNAQRPFPVC
jgi:hypothetical protein